MEVPAAIVRDAPANEAPHEAAPREPFVRHVLDGNLAVVPFGRYGLTYQFLPAHHQALVVTAYRQSPSFVDGVNNGLLGVGGEVGWRIYTGSRGPTGLFLGVSGVAAYHTTDITPWFATYGACADAGIAFLLGRTYHVVIGGGAQLAWADVDASPLTDVARWLVGTGIAPRLTIALGHSLGRGH